MDELREMFEAILETAKHNNMQIESIGSIKVFYEDVGDSYDDVKPNIEITGLKFK